VVLSLETLVLHGPLGGELALGVALDGGVNAVARKLELKVARDGTGGVAGQVRGVVDPRVGLHLMLDLRVKHKVARKQVLDLLVLIVKRGGSHDVLL